MSHQKVVRSLAFPIPEGSLPDRLVWLLKQFRLMANLCIRAAIDNNITSR